jgi:hypothetical protein
MQRQVSPGPRRAAGSWLVVLAAAAVALALTGYRARDPDSRLYAEISARMSQAPAARWIAPEFPPGWYMGGLFREHPVGLFVPAAGLAALGYPVEQAAYVTNAIYQVLGIVLLQRLAASFVSGLESRSLAWLIQLLPIAFTFRIRANHEAAMLLCLLAALYGTQRTLEGRGLAALAIGGCVGLLLVKGILAVFGPLLCALWLVTRGARFATRGERAAWLTLAASVASMAAAGVVYELAYRQATGEPFWSFYLARQLGVAAAAGDGASVLGARLYTLVWYLARLVWFAFPWSLALLLALARARGRSGEPRDEAARQVALFAALAAAAYVLAFSLSDRRADRYIFPAYYAVGAAGAVAALRGLPGLRRIAEHLDRPWVPAAVWGATFAAHLLAGRLGLPTIKIWAG